MKDKPNKPTALTRKTKTYLDTSLRNTVPHNPPESYGDCFRVCFACILGLKIEDVPHFWGEVRLYEEVEKDIVSFLGNLGYYLYSETLHNDLEGTGIEPKEMFEEWVKSTKGVRIPYILGAVSQTGVSHSVVVWDGKIIMNSSPDSYLADFINGEYAVAYHLVADQPHWQRALDGSRIVNISD